MADRSEAVREFVTVTDVDEERALFFLESAGWDLQLALASFYEDGAEDEAGILPQPERPPVPEISSQPRVTSFRDLVHEDQDQGDEEGQRFYAGGSERSGQQILGPPKKKSSHEVVEDLFKGAKEHGAVPVDRAGKSPGESSKARPFLGGGYRLGATTEEQSTYVAGERRSSDSKQEVHVVLKLWKDGFSLNDGDLRTYSDPGNSQFLESIRRGEIPMELRQLSQGGQVNVDMEDHRDEEYSKPKPAFKAFGGEGQKLGSATPQVVSYAGISRATPSQAAEASTAIVLDDMQPITNIQVRLADGSRLVQKFNHVHRVSDVRRFIVGSRPGMAAVEFLLMTTFPNKELRDESLTLSQAGLLNAVIVQKLK